ncbi:hypothetical protein JXA88_09405 [Candidatus Fermentibacteria bacterium]|nr:hypothetical protein [Candidatus Fermentibacteria bacterium]
MVCLAILLLMARWQNLSIGRHYHNGKVRSFADSAGYSGVARISAGGLARIHRDRL